MRSIWTGAINFGMVTIPVKLYSATEERDVTFHLVHKTDGARIVEKRFCSAENKEVEWDDIARGVEGDNGEVVIVDPDEIDEAAPEVAKTIDIGDFVEAEEIDPIYFQKSYFLEPTEVGAKPFHLLRRALAETSRVAVARVALRNKERLATVRVYQETLALETMYWPDEIRSISELELNEGKARVTAREVEMAQQLIDNLSSHFEPDKYEDRYRIALQELIERKAKGEQRAAKRRKPEPKVTDLMEALQASLDASRSASGKATAAATKAAGRKPAARKPAGTRRRKAA
jgi:DNA end-binding protein Ku